MKTWCLTRIKSSIIEAILDRGFCNYGIEAVLPFLNQEILDQNRFTFKNKKPVTPKSLLQFLYKIDFITARIEKNGEIERRYFDQGRFLAHEYADFGYEWEIHPAYRWALQPQDLQGVISSLK